jgi:hypothetical protein
MKSELQLKREEIQFYEERSSSGDLDLRILAASILIDKKNEFNNLKDNINGQRST